MRLNHLKWLFTVAAVFGGSFVLGRAMGGVFDTVSDSDSPSLDQLRLAAPRAGRQLVFVYVGSSRCGPSNAPHVSENVADLITQVRQHAVSAQSGFVAIGIAREMSAESGLGHLQKIGRFDEISAGQGKLNQASEHFVTRDLRGAPATPQIVIVERILGGEADVNLAVLSERVLVRKIGRQEIQAWLDLQAPLPDLTPVTHVTPKNPSQDIAPHAAWRAN